MSYTVRPLWSARSVSQPSVFKIRGQLKIIRGSIFASKLVRDWFLLSPDVIGVTKSRKIKWAVRVSPVWEVRNPYTFLLGKSKGKRHFGLRWEVNCIILKLILKKQGVNMWAGRIYLSGSYHLLAVVNKENFLASRATVNFPNSSLFRAVNLLLMFNIRVSVT
jgi:hypothetical protein